jgi:hypothetical protein
MECSILKSLSTQVARDQSEASFSWRATVAIFVYDQVVALVEVLVRFEQNTQSVRTGGGQFPRTNHHSRAL